VNRGCIKGAPPWWWSFARQLIPRRRPRDCCYYHRIDWHQVSAATIRIARQAHSEGLTGQRAADRAAVLALSSDLPTQERRALAELVEGEDAYTEELARLTDWVEGFLLPNYGEGLLRRCWPAHMRAIWELGAL
jgi:hypothetical protein